MCGSSPKIEPPKPAPPPAPPPPPLPEITPVQPATDSTSAGDRKRRSRDALRIDLTNSASGSSGLNIPT